MMKYKAWFFLIFCNLFWAGNMIFGKYVMYEYPAIWTAFLRWLIALIFLIPIAQFIEKPAWLQIWKKHFVVILLLSVTVAIYTVLTYESLQYTSSTNGALINSLTPATIMLFSLMFQKEKITTFQVIGIITSFIGVLIVLTKGNLLQLFHIEYNKGDMIMILAVLAWTMYSLLGKKTKGMPTATLIAITSFIAVIIMLPFLFIQPLQINKITVLGIEGMLYLGIFPSVGSFILWNKSIKIVGAGIAGISMNLIPIFTAILALLLGQGLVTSQIIGGIIVIGGMLLTSMKRKQVAPKPELT
ncbi:DMT family transporter [Paenibacillus tyrfis]|nr:DMT family transporter [Paenibacillus tyrfis]